MAVLFSAVALTAAARGERLEFLVGGIPRNYEDLEGWSAFDNYFENINEDMDISIHADAYLYGESSPVIPPSRV